MAEIILFDFSKLLLTKLAPLLADEIRLYLGVDDELDSLHTNLIAIKAVLQDAEKRQKSQTVRVWLENLEDLVYDIDDLFDDIAVELSHRHKSKRTGWLNQASRFLSCSNPYLFQSLLAHRIRDISSRLDSVAKSRRDFKFHSDFVDANEVLESHSKLPKSEILGREDDKRKIIDLILECGDSERLSVVPIVGFGGVGKTTMAKLIYNDPRIESSFDEKLWVYASVNFSEKKILEQIVRVLCKENSRVMMPSVQEMHMMLEAELRTKKYFLILDDLWNEDPNVWRNLRELLDGGARGSTVVVTTRVPQVAKVVKTVADEYTLQPLSREICMLIFKELAFGGRRVQRKLEEMAGRIVDRCGGLPLAVTFLGNLLSGVTEESEWDEIVRKLENGHEGILEKLKLSYDQLPSYLKPCFQSLACYLQGSMTDAQVFVSTWMALGFLSTDQSRQFEQTGRRYILELLSKSFLHHVEYNFGDLIREFEIHDFVHDLAKFVAGDEMAVVNCKTVVVPQRARYITFREDNLEGKRFPHNVFNVKKARVFTLYTLEQTPAEFLRYIISNFKCLRVLNLRGCDVELLPDSVGDLKHLRMLDLGDNVRIKRLPDTVCNLFNLQSFFLDCCTAGLQALPQRIRDLENLRYLSLTTQEEHLSLELGGLHNLRTLFLFNCPRLCMLPFSFANLKNLEQLWIAYCEKLNPTWDLLPDIDGGRPLEFDNLHTLNIEGLPNLDILRIFGKSLQRLGIVKCHGLSNLPSWIGSYTSLQALSIIDCPSLMALPKSFRNLTQLQRLKIVACPELNKRCARDIGVDWPLISHVPDVILLDQEEM